MNEIHLMYSSPAAAAAAELNWTDVFAYIQGHFADKAR